MKLMTFGLVSALALSAAAPALAQTADAVAATDLNIRSGPGPAYQIVGVIPAGETATVDGCLETAHWCQVSHDGTVGWSSSDYLAVGVNDQAVALATRPATVTVATTTYVDAEETHKDQNVGAAAGATIGALTAYALGGPIGGIIAGGILGSAAGVASVEPTEKTITYIKQDPVETVYLDGEVVVGAGVPTGVPTYETPQPELRYAYINGVPVVIDAKTNTIVSIVR